MEVPCEMFAIAVVILGLFIVGTIDTYVRTSLPTKISTYYASNAIEDVVGTAALNPEEGVRLLKHLGNEYSHS